MNELEEDIGKQVVADVLISTGNIYSGVLLSLWVLIRDCAALVLGWGAIVFAMEFDDLWGFSFGVLNVIVALLLFGATIKTSSPVLGAKPNTQVAVLKLLFSGAFGSSLATAFAETRGFFNNVLWPFLSVVMAYLLVHEVLMKMHAFWLSGAPLFVGTLAVLVLVLKRAIRLYLVDELKVEPTSIANIPYKPLIALTLCMAFSPLLIPIPIGIWMAIKLIKDTAEQMPNNNS